VRWLATAFAIAMLARTCHPERSEGSAVRKASKDFHHASKKQCSLTSRAALTTLPGNVFPRTVLAFLKVQRGEFCGDFPFLA
jgi:hypothetical protein